MCGICGCYEASEPADPELIQRMLGALRHRGPDGSGYYRDESVTLGHTRLAIIDAAGGVQPMTGEDGRVWVAFNGEIFNYVEIRTELISRGHAFRTRSDTEVIVHAWEEWGAECFRRFNGQWALAIWDRRTRELTLCRDRYGIHPLFYAFAGRRLVFGSEVKALFCDDAVARRLDPVGLDELLTFWAVVPPRTLFDGVRQVEPGTFVTVTGSGVSTRSYWSPTFPQRGREQSQDIVENAERLRDAVIASTRLRFRRSDVPVGAYLSGGIDSAVTAALVARFAANDVQTYSLRFADPEYDEGEYQRTMSDVLHTSHHEVVVGERDIADALPDAIWHAESGLLRSAAVPMFLLSELVHRSGHRVVVTGEGADEVLAGYDLFREDKVRRFAARNAASATRAGAVEALYPWLQRSPALAPAFAQSFFALRADPLDPAMSHRPRWGSTAVLKTMLQDGVRIADGDAAADALIARMPSEAARWDPLSRAQWLEIRTLLAGYLLSSQGDRMLMAHSVEGRFPFLDPDVFDLAATFPARQKILGLDEKHLLKRAFSDLVPTDILRRPKQPYRAPDAAGSLLESEPDWLHVVASSATVESDGIFTPDVVARLLEKCRRTAGKGLGNTDSMRLMAVVTIQLVNELFVTNWRRPSAEPPQPMAVFGNHRSKD